MNKLIEKLEPVHLFIIIIIILIGGFGVIGFSLAVRTSVNILNKVRINEVKSNDEAN